MLLDLTIILTYKQHIHAHSANFQPSLKNIDIKIKHFNLIKTSFQEPLSLKNMWNNFNLYDPAAGARVFLSNLALRLSSQNGKNIYRAYWIKESLSCSERDIMKAYTWCGCKFHAYLTLTLDGSEGSAWISVKKSLRYQFDRRLGGTWSVGTWWRRNKSWLYRELNPGYPSHFYVETKDPENSDFCPIFKYEQHYLIWDAEVRAVTEHCMCLCDWCVISIRLKT
jgi:hypothetical protein